MLKLLLNNFENELKEALKYEDGLKLPKIELEGKIIYPNMAKEFIALFDKKGFYTNQKCFIVTLNKPNEDEYLYLTAFLNSKANFWYFKQIGATLGATGYEMSKIFVEKLPIPKPTFKSQALVIQIASLTREILKSKEKDEDTQKLESEVDSLVYRLYGLSPEERAFIENQML
ncbi:TaqI-like C-terminal specificity domain-containing protein [Helicobacter sp. 11S02596-1]|uniref:TaqI-like C-terminal specificity domain-containing protein n=1 Tax=Helicobacter sp. 11S02596-1 TaxID=1476194 RepID=UPI00117ACE2D|nr:TaqI-like C-terminal specificity domain-containing protein [Helicobacter sp. 11S02596-1]